MNLLKVVDFTTAVGKTLVTLGRLEYYYNLYPNHIKQRWLYQKSISKLTEISQKSEKNHIFFYETDLPRTAASLSLKSIVTNLKSGETSKDLCRASVNGTSTVSQRRCFKRKSEI